MKCENRFSLVPLKMIRIIKGIKISEMAKYFDCSQSYIIDIENGTRIMYKNALFNGLEKLGISYEEYKELIEFQIILSESNISDEDKYKYMLIKTISIFLPNDKEKLNYFLNDTMCNNNIEKLK